eukprot:5872867-Ditylum_brightwellii.AAC.1
MRDPPPGIGVLGIGWIEKPLGIGTIVFKITESTLEAKTIELENVLYMPSIPKNLISISQWSAERKDDCGILSRAHLRNMYHTQLIAGYQCCRHMRKERLNMIDFKKNTNPTSMISIAC